MNKAAIYERVKFRLAEAAQQAQQEKRRTLALAMAQRMHENGLQLIPEHGVIVIVTHKNATTVH
jgi:hypothetical protein